MSKRDIDIQTPDGVCRAGLTTGSGRPKAGVILYMDAFGPRPALDQIAERLAGEGYAVLVPDLYYRQGAYGPFDARTAFSTEDTAKQIRSLMSATTQAMTQADTAHFLKVFDAEGLTGKVGTTGYCMGGHRSLNAAAAHPDRIAAAASFHGGNLAGDAPDTPAANAGRIRARVYVGSAGIDKSFPPEQSAKLAQALRVAEVDHTIENYVGVEHGWCVSDHGAYDHAGAERHWKRLLELFSETLG